MSRVIRVSERLADDLDVHPGREHERGRDVAKVVKPDRRQTGGGDQPLEEVAHLARVEQGAVLLSEYSSSVFPALAPLLALALLTKPVSLEHFEGLVVQGDEADARVGLRSTLVNLPAVLDELRGDGQ
jgi:hypothetical protein